MRMERALRAGGGCDIEDLCMRSPFAADDLRDLHAIVCVISMSSPRALMGSELIAQRYIRNCRVERAGLANPIADCSGYCDRTNPA